MGLSQHGFARASGLCQASVSEYERGAKLPRAATLPKLATCLGVGLDDIEQMTRPTSPAVRKGSHEHSVRETSGQAAIAG